MTRAKYAPCLSLSALTLRTPRRLKDHKLIIVVVAISGSESEKGQHDIVWYVVSPRYVGDRTRKACLVFHRVF